MPSLQCERSAILLCGLGLALANALYAQGVGRQGEEFSISDPRIGDQTIPQAAIGPAGGYVVWQDNAIDGPGKSFGIGARRLNQDLTPTAMKFPFRINRSLGGPQQNPQVTLMKNGGAAVVWQGGRIGGQDIYFRTILPLPQGGLFPTNDVRVNSFLTGQQSTPVITCLPNGNLVVAWSSLHQDKYLEGIYARLVTPKGKFPGAHFRVNQVTTGNQRSPAITTLSNGNFVVVWVSENQGVSMMETLRHTNRVHVYARVFGQGGSPLGNEFRVNTRSNFCATPSIAPWGSQGFTIVWAERANDWDICARTFSASDMPAPDAVLVNEVTVGDQMAPKIAQAGSQHLVVWNSAGRDGSREGVLGRLLTEGQVNSPEFVVNTYNVGAQIQPVVAGDKEDRLLVAWSSYLESSAFDIHSQRYHVNEANNPGLEMTMNQSPSTSGPGAPPPPTGLTPVYESGSTVTPSRQDLRVSLANTSKGTRLSWNTEPGRIYQVQYSTNFSRWENLGEPRAAAAASDSTVVGKGEDAAFYRVVRLP